MQADILFRRWPKIARGISLTTDSIKQWDVAKIAMGFISAVFTAATLWMATTVSTLASEISSLSATLMHVTERNGELTSQLKSLDREIKDLRLVVFQSDKELARRSAAIERVTQLEARVRKLEQTPPD